MTDLKLIETLNGGDLVKSGNDLATVTGVENTPYLAMFGGSRWWGNYLLPPEKQFLSKTEELLKVTPLTSGGRMLIQKAVNDDLEFLNNIEGTNWSSTVNITGENRVEIGVNINGQQFDYLWNPKEDASKPAPIVCPILTGLTVTEVQATEISFEWTGNGYGTYQYAYNTDGETPTSWTSTSLTSAIIDDLDGDTTYYIFVRTVCGGTYSEPASTSGDTFPVPAPLYPERIVGSYWSFAGVHRAGTGIPQIEDISGNGNHIHSDDTDANYMPNVFGSLPAIGFSGNNPLSTAGDFVGISGGQKCTVFFVYKVPVPEGANTLVAYAPGGGVALPGQFAIIDNPGSPIDLAVVVRGNVGFDTGKMPNVADTPAVMAVRIEFSSAAISELRIFKNGSDTGFVPLSSSENTGVFASEPLEVGVISYCELGCLVVYNDGLTDGEILANSNYLMTLFSI